jgi:hypothetical protein
MAAQFWHAGKNSPCVGPGMILYVTWSPESGNIERFSGR